MYQKYTTLGFIVSSRANKEADMLYLCYTEEFGMILASATSVRTSKSKLRGKLKVGTLLKFTVIKSKTSWKLVEVEEGETELSPKTDAYKKFSRILLVLKSLIHGEEKSESLFCILVNFYTYLLTSTDAMLLEGAECLAMIQVLHTLGYGGNTDFHYYVYDEFNDEALMKVSENKAILIKGINQSLKITGF